MPNNYTIRKRRYLNRARIAFGDINFFKTLNDEGSFIRDIHKKPIELRNIISRLFHLSENLSFRQNATQCFRDILVGLLYYLKNERQIKLCKVFLSDLDHPVMKQMVKAIIPHCALYECKLATEVILNNEKNISDLTTLFVNEVIRSGANIVLIPHVNWINGGKLDVVTICKKLKEYDQLLVTIVDGAQALANIQTTIDDKGCNNDIDFYIGCGQKWMGSPIPIGFVRVSEKYCNIESFNNFIFIGDVFSKHGGRLDVFTEYYLDTYNIHFAMLLESAVKEMFEDEKGSMIAHYYNKVFRHLIPIREIIEQFPFLKIIDPNKTMLSGILTVSAEEDILSALYQELQTNNFDLTKDSIEIENTKTHFLRISSPLERLIEEDKEIFMNLLKEVAVYS